MHSFKLYVKRKLSLVKFIVLDIKVYIRRLTLSRHLSVPNKGVLHVSLLVMEIYVSHAKADFVAVIPLKVVHQRPSKVALKVHAIKYDGIDRVLDVTFVKINSEFIMNGISN